MKKDINRMCVVCREMKSRDDLIKIVINKDNDQYFIDNVKASGRGAYVCRNATCIDKCIKTHALNRAYKRNLPSVLYEDLRKVELNEG